jgi:hypothetical protein
MRVAETGTDLNLVVGRDALDEPDLVFRREGGGFGLDCLDKSMIRNLLNQP